jgi:hypothetical protein
MSALLCGELSTESSNPSLRAKRSNPWSHVKEEWIASSLSLLAMTARCSSAISRHQAPELCKNLSPRRGRGECRVPVAPAASCAKCRKHTSVVTTSSPEHPAFPHAMVLTAYFALSPVIGLVCHRRLADTLRDLTPASRRQDHTTSPSASQAHLVKCAAASTASRPASVTIAIRPSSGTRRRKLLK